MNQRTWCYIEEYDRDWDYCEHGHRDRQYENDAAKPSPVRATARSAA